MYQLQLLLLVTLLITALVSHNVIYLFDFPEIVNNYGLKRGTVCQIERFIFHFSLKLYIQI